MVFKEPKFLKSFIKYLLLAITQEIRWLFSHSNNYCLTKNNLIKNCPRCFQFMFTLFNLQGALGDFHRFSLSLTAFAFYHIQFHLSRTFFKFFQIFSSRSFLAAHLSNSVILAYPSELVKHFFQVFANSFWICYFVGLSR